MKYVFLLLSLFMISAFNISAQEVKTKKEVIIVKEKDGKVIKKRVTTSSDDEMEDFFKQKDINPKDIATVDVEVETEGDEIVKKIKVKLKDGREEQFAFTEEKGEEDFHTMIIDIDGIEEDIELINEADIKVTMDAPTPKVKMGVMLGGGLTVDEVFKGSAADKAGMEKGDVIKKIDQQIIYSYRGLMEHLSSYNPGDKVKVMVDREGKEKSMKMVFDSND